MKNLDVNEFVEYYNSIEDVHDNAEGGGTTPDSKIVIEFYSGKTISIYDDIRSLYLCIEEPDGKMLDYTGKQEQIENILNKEKSNEK